MASDARILGEGGFVERVIAEAEARERETLRLRRRVPGLSTLLTEVAEKEGMKEEDLLAPRKKREVVGVVKLFCQLAVRRYGYTGASVARFLGFTTSLVNRYASAGNLLDG